MDSPDSPAPRPEEGPFQSPWPALWTGLGLTALTVAWFRLLGDVATPARAVALALGLLALGAAVAIRPRSALVLGLAGAGTWLACLATNPEWDSFRLLFGVVGSVAAAAAGLVLLPRTARRVAVSLLILFHFGGILTAVSSVPPQPWLSSMMWSYVYRPYLEFMYLNNAYHFYSPDPGPPTLLWCYVKYEDGTARWVKLPNREDFPLKVNYQRRLSLTESINQLTLANATPPALLDWARTRRAKAGELLEIPFHPSLDLAHQYRLPVLFSKKMLETYARHVAHTTPHLLDPGQRVTSVKMYRVIHNLPLAAEMAAGYSPLDPVYYLPYYQGEYDPDGNLLYPEDPFLYWLIPIFRLAKDGRTPIGAGSLAGLPGPEDSVVHDYLQLHADSDSTRLSARVGQAVGAPAAPPAAGVGTPPGPQPATDPLKPSQADRR